MNIDTLDRLFLSNPQETKNSSAWSTATEIDYLKTIGNNHPVVGKTKRDFLIGYLKGAKHRVEWRGIKPDKVIAYAEALLAVA